MPQVGGWMGGGFCACVFVVGGWVDGGLSVPVSVSVSVRWAGGVGWGGGKCWRGWVRVRKASMNWTGIPIGLTQTTHPSRATLRTLSHAPPTR